MRQRSKDVAVRAFRVARPARRNWIVAKTSVQLVGVWGFALGVLREGQGPLAPRATGWGSKYRSQLAKTPGTFVQS